MDYIVYMYIRSMCQSVTEQHSVGGDDGSGAPGTCQNFRISSARGAVRLVRLFPAQSKFALLLY